MVSIEPYTNKINEIARKYIFQQKQMILKIAALFPLDLKYLDLGKKVLIVCENAINQYPTRLR